MSVVYDEKARCRFPVGGGDMGATIRDDDWTVHPIGIPTAWPAPLRSAVNLMLNSVDPAWLAWGPQLTFLYNDAYRPMLGRKVAPLGRPLAEVWGEIWDDVGPLVTRTLAGEPISLRNVPLRIERGAGSEEAFFTFAYAPLHDDDGRVQGLFCNVSETTAEMLARHRSDTAEEALRELNAGLERKVAERTQERDRLWQLSRDMLGVADDTGVWHSVNPAWTQVLGWQPDDIVGRTSQWMEHPDDQQRTRSEVRSLAAGATTFDFENRFRTRDGAYRALSWTATPDGGFLYCIARDVTAEREREAALRLFKNIVESAGAPICGFDGDLRVIAFNRAQSDVLRRLHGCGLEHGDAFLDQLPGDEAATLRAHMIRALGGEAFTVVEQLGHPDREQAHFELTYAPVSDDAGRIIGAFHYAHDVSERLRAEAELDVVRDALRQSQKMEAVGQLTGGLAHDFNNLLAGISGSLELMQARVRQGRFGEVERYLAVAQGATKRAAALTHRLLAFSRRQTLAPRPTGVNKLVLSMQEMVQRTVGPAIVVDVVGASGAWPALVDPSQLENALLNLCINARDAMPSGGRITIETANRWFDARAAQQHGVPEGQYLSLCVTDTGTGMAPDVIERAFEPFFTTKPIGKGTGLGLSMIYGFAQQSGGQVRIYSEVGQGTTVCIYLPRYLGEIGEDDSGVPVPPLPRSEQGETVLVVDDEPTVRMLLVEILDELGYAAVEAADSAAGLKLLMSDARIDLLVTDVGLPGGMNGRQMADAARVGRPELKVLFITGYAENAAVGNGQLDPGMAVMTKPFEIEAMAARIRTMIES